MKRILLNFLHQYLFWLVFFALNRTIFLAYNIGNLDGAVFLDVLASYWNALYLDTSTAAYILILPFLFLLIRSYLNWRFLDKLNFLYSCLVMILLSLITSSELELYREWGTKLNYKALSHLIHPDEVAKSAPTSTLIMVVLLVLAQSGLGIWVYRKYLYKNLHHEKWQLPLSIPFTLLTPFLLILAIRGGTQEIPINQSDAFFSDHYILNIAAVNSAWNLGHSIEQNKYHMGTHPYRHMKKEKAEKIVEELHHVPKDTSTSLLTTKRPNIVMLILESWSSDLIEPLGGYKGITPFFNEISKEGVLFKNMYATGARSDQGMAAIFSGFPAQPTTSIIKQPSKFQQLPCINDAFNREGYHTSFFFGGQLAYGNIKAYMMYNDFDHIMEGKDFPDRIPRGKLGVHDEFLLEQQLQHLQQESTPFFSAAFTMSSHSPYDMPMEKWPIERGGNERDYLNSMLYADQCLKTFFQKARQKEWYDNTLFILVSDHSHSSPEGHHFYSPPYRKIPMLFYGNVLKKEHQGTLVNRICSQTDLPATLLHQLELPYEQFRWSKNLFNPYGQEFAYYGFLEGLGWIRPEGYYVYEENLDRFFQKELPKGKEGKRIEEEGKAYLQVLYEEYLNY